MNLWLEIIKPHLIKILLVSSLSLWALTSTFIALTSKNEVLLIGIDQNGTRLITSQEDPLFKTELVGFLRHYFSLSYEFTPKNFTHQVGSATSLLSESLWKKEASNIKKLKTLVESSGLSQSLQIKQLNQVSREKFQALLNIHQKTRLKTQDFQMKVSLGLQKIPRTKNNPWGMEITQLVEEKL